MTDSFYSKLTPYYHLIYPDWDASIRRQANMLDAVIRREWHETSSVLDVSCGIGTQALGLSELGYAVTASDISGEEVERAQHEADARGVSVSFSVADMREAYDHHAARFDVVLSCDNSVPHLLSDDEILCAFKQFYACIRPGGGCIISVRDYEKEDITRQQVKPYGMREENGVRWLLWQVWDPRPPCYDVSMYLVEDRGSTGCQTHVMRSTYYAVTISRLIELMGLAGFRHIQRQDDVFFQPIIIGTKE